MPRANISAMPGGMSMPGSLMSTQNSLRGNPRIAPGPHGPASFGSPKCTRTENRRSSRGGISSGTSTRCGRPRARHCFRHLPRPQVVLCLAGARLPPPLAGAAVPRKRCVIRPSSTARTTGRRVAARAAPLGETILEHVDAYQWELVKAVEREERLVLARLTGGPRKTLTA